LPPRIAWQASTQDDVPAAATLGDEFEPADVVSRTVASASATARLWIRDDAIVLVDVPLDGGSSRLAHEDLGAPEQRRDVTYGLVFLSLGEWIYAARGLALVADEVRVRHVMGFVPCGVDEYERRLRIRFETTRRPLASRHVEEDL
jgi:hypothetical protein